MSGLILSGDVFIKRSGIDTGYLKLLNTKEFKVTVANPDTKERRSYSRSNYGALLGSYARPGTHSISLMSDEFDKDTVAMAFLGTSSAATVTAGAGTASVTPVRGQWVVFVDAPVAAESVSANAGVEGTDYVIDYQGGMIKSISATGDTITSVYYTTVASSGYKVDAQTVPNLRCEVMLLGENLTSGEKVKFLAGAATLSPSGDINLLAEDYNTFSLSGGLEIPTGETVPYTLTVLS